MRLIDADKIVYSWQIDADGNEHDGVTLQSIIDKMPTIEERKNGKWVKISPSGIYECSVCGQNVMTQDIDVYLYCHGCGAVMGVRHE